MRSSLLFLFFFNAPATTEIYTLSLHDALPICRRRVDVAGDDQARVRRLVIRLEEVDDVLVAGGGEIFQDRKSTRLNSSHTVISYAVFCLKKKKKKRKKLIKKTKRKRHIIRRQQ